MTSPSAALILAASPLAGAGLVTTTAATPGLNGPGSVSRCSFQLWGLYQGDGSLRKWIEWRRCPEEAAEGEVRSRSGRTEELVAPLSRSKLISGHTSPGISALPR